MYSDLRYSRQFSDGTVPLNGFVFTLRKRKKTIKSYSTPASRQLYMPPYLHVLFVTIVLLFFYFNFILLNNCEYNIRQEWIYTSTPNVINNKLVVNHTLPTRF